MHSPEAEYTRLLDQYRKEQIRHQKICRIFTWLRAVTFIGILINIYFALTSGSPVTGFIMTGFFLVLLLVFVFLNTRYSGKLNYFTRLVQLSEAELSALNHQTEEFRSGSEFIDPDHLFSSDLDLFGDGSFFQYLNRAVTRMGTDQLVSWLRDPGTESGDILQRQEACRELATHTEWRLSFMAIAPESGKEESSGNFKQWLGMHDLFRNHRVFLMLIRAGQVIMTLLTIFVIAGWLPFTLMLLMGLLFLGITGFFIRRINEISHLFGKTYSLLSVYSGLIRKTGEIHFQSGWMGKRINTLVSGDASAARETEELGKLLERFDHRNNLLIGFFRNALFLTDLLLVLRMEIWRRKNTGNLIRWFDALGEIDAMNSLATLAFNNPTYSYPEINEQSFYILAENLGHPMIPAKERVCNPFEINNWQTMIVLTGANMAGKSTFLRTVGLNFMLAHTGSPVCATRFIFRPAQLVTSIRTNDSLIRHESYFYAELKKLRKIIELLENGGQIFFLLDEVLKGTNSNDKLNGSIILLKKLLKLRTSGIIATHDVALGELETEFPGQILNYCFEADLSGDQLSFDYKIRPGVAQNMTAQFLMKKMGIV